MHIPEADWRVTRSLHATALDRFCARVLDECRAVLDDETASSHERYLRLFRLVGERDDALAGAFNDLRRSTALRRLVAMHALGLLSDEDLDRLSPESRETVRGWADLLR